MEASQRLPPAGKRQVQFVWTTDPHFDHVDRSQWDRWLLRILSLRPDGLLITGDISEGQDVLVQLERLVDRFDGPIFFVLGNHDFYQNSIARTRQQVVALAREQTRLHYLTDLGPIALADGVFLVGDDGWGDATVGDYERSTIRLRDFQQIDDFRLASPHQWKSMLQQQGSESAARLRQKLDGIPASAKTIVVATHLPPFVESCWYQGRTTDEFWAPFFVCGSIGQVLREASASRCDCDFVVLCGHTHHEGVASLTERLTVYTGAAQYGLPGIEAVLRIESDRFIIRREPPSTDPARYLS